MKARLLCCAIVVAPLIGAGCATHDVPRPGDRTFDKDTQTPGSAVSQAPGTVVVPPPPPGVVVPPAQPQVVVPPGQPVVVQPSPSSGGVVAGTPGVAGSQMVQVNALEANEVRAQTIYANRIQAPDIRGTVYQTGGVRMDRAVSNLRTPTVTAGVVYADTIKADRVIADQIYVRELERR